MSLHALICAQYEKFPYPSIPLFAKARAEDCHLMNYEAGLVACFGHCSMAAERPRILVAGCGTFEPYIVALANPSAEIIGLDFSKAALKKLRWRMRFHGIRNIQYVCSSIEEIPAELGKFHMIVATGVLHHLLDPSQGLRKLASMLEEKGVMRMMLYSKYGRNNVYKIRDLASALEVSNGKDLQNIISSLPANHPLKIHFHLYTDARNESGIHDGFLNVIDKPFDALELRAFLVQAELEAAFFVHSPSGQPDRFTELADAARKDCDIWQKVAVLDRISELESNFIFFAAKRSDLEAGTIAGGFKINPATASARGRAIYSKILGENITLSSHTRRLWNKPVISINEIPAAERDRLQKALWLLPLKE